MLQALENAKTRLKKTRLKTANTLFIVIPFDVDIRFAGWRKRHRVNVAAAQACCCLMMIIVAELGELV